MTQVRDQDSLRFASDVPPNSTVTLRRRLQEEGTVEKVRVRIYPGAELDLRVEPFIEIGDSNSHRLPLITYGGNGKTYVDGDDDTFEFQVSEFVDGDEVVGVRAENLDGSNTYDFAMDVVLVREGDS